MRYHFSSSFILKLETPQNKDLLSPCEAQDWYYIEFAFTLKVIYVTFVLGFCWPHEQLVGNMFSVTHVPEEAIKRHILVQLYYTYNVDDICLLKMWLQIKGYSTDWKMLPFKLKEEKLWVCTKLLCGCTVKDMYN